MHGPEKIAAGTGRISLRSEPHGQGKALRILYAEDMPELRDVARISLARDGHAIECAEDGAVAWEKISADPGRFDLVITDHHMPNMNGVELVLRLRSLPFPGKIMVFSSELSREVNNAYRELKVDRILFKPVLPTVLRGVLAELCPAENSDDSLAPSPTLKA
jgi:two-component system chemotaxis response regulator CheY